MNTLRIILKTLTWNGIAKLFYMKSPQCHLKKGSKRVRCKTNCLEWAPIRCNLINNKYCSGHTNSIFLKKHRKHYRIIQSPTLWPIWMQSQVEKQTLVSWLGGKFFSIHGPNISPNFKSPSLDGTDTFKCWSYLIYCTDRICWSF